MNQTELGNICKLRNGYAFKSDDFINDGIPIVRIGDINNGNINLDSTIKVKEKDLFNSFLIQKGAILIAMSGATTGKIGKYSSDIKAYQNQRVGCFIPDNDKINNEYLYCFLKTLKDKILQKAYGGGQPNISPKDIESLKIPLPPLNDQIRIADLLTRAEMLIAKRKESIKALDEFLKSTFLEMFGDPVKNEKGWDILPLGEKLKIKHGFAYLGEYFSNAGEYVLLTPGNFFEEGGYRDRGDKQKYYLGEIPQDYILQKGDLLIAMTEQASGLLGSSIIVPASNKYLHNQRLGLIVLKNNDMNKVFVFHLFNHVNIRKIIHANATGTKVRHTSPTKIEEIEVSIPPITLQNKFAAIVEKVEAMKVKYNESLVELEKLYGSLSQRAFRGEL